MSDTFLELIPDRPEWVEARGALKRGGRALGRAGGAAIVSPEREMVFVAGRPDRTILEQALDGCAPDVEILAQEADAEHVSKLLGSAGGAALIHVPRGSGLQARAGNDDSSAATLAVQDLDAIGSIDPELRDELADALHRTAVTTIVAEGRPVSFCYAGSVTERWWDVSIDTLEPYRRRGFAAAAFQILSERMSREGKTPVWGAYVSNEASWRLARKLGFRPAARVFVWAAGGGRYRPGDEE